MPSIKSHIIAQLEKEILPLQGLKSLPGEMELDLGLGPVNDAFPGSKFPSAGIHEMLYKLPEEAAATAGFLSGLLSGFMKKGGPVLWISRCRMLFPPALSLFGVVPEHIIFVDLKKEKDILWAMEEALTCDGLAAVVAQVQDISFTASRRLQLAVEQSRVTGFLMRECVGKMGTTASLTRWKISCLPSAPISDLPGVGFPKWHVELLKVRNGKPGCWQIGWKNGMFLHNTSVPSIMPEVHRKTG